MINLHAVRAVVKLKLRMIRGATEETIHDVYQRAFLDELENARDTANALRQLLTNARVRSPKGWILVEREEVERYEALVGKFVESLKL